jgi:protoporphyrinogen oxidase
MRTVVVGGGIAGAVAALRLAEGGQDVTLLEAGEALGGLVVSFSVAGTPLECFYHHVFPHEHEIVSLIDELGLADRMEWLPSSVGVLTGGRLWGFTSPLDLLRFGPLRPWQRLKAGIGALSLSREKDWQRLDTITAMEWLRSATGAAAVRTIWEPLLAAKFGPAAPDVPAAWMWGRVQQRLGARRGSVEKLGYMRGGFRQLFDALQVRLDEAGVKVLTQTRATALEHLDGRITGVRTGDALLACESVLYTGALPGLTRLLPDELIDERWRMPGLGVVCVVLETDRPVSSTYWTNVCDPALPFGGIIEHTNLLPASDYGNRHVVYLSRYYTQDEPIATADLNEEVERWLAAFEERHPGFHREIVTAVHPFRAPYAAPLVRTGHLGRIPPLRADLMGLYVSTTGQIYPQDRGMSEGVRTGAAAAGELLSDAAQVRA